jgi:hypothetical protein
MSRFCDDPYIGPTTPAGKSLLRKAAMPMMQGGLTTGESAQRCHSFFTGYARRYSLM